MRRGRTRAQDLVVAERRLYVFQLRQAGASYREIADTIARDPRWNQRLPRRYDRVGVYRDCVAELQRQRTELAELVEDVRQLELTRLDRMQLALWSAATHGDVAAIDRVLAIMARRAKYLPGLEVPLRLHIDPLEELARLLGIPKEELPPPALARNGLNGASHGA
jgi:hypothetical protein